ncbi:caspase family protein [Streptomyces umbrinus]|uniref:caspase family protein n=1 Tax=Streptomyces umbrinus TaxID=67370 RepID=UPI0033F6E3FF
MPGPTGSRAVLIGVSHYDQLTDLPNVERNLTELRRLLTSPRSWNLAEENCRVVSDPTDRWQMLDTVQKAAEEATDALLVYYAGHGLIDADEEEFFLSLRGSQHHTMWTGVEYKYLRGEIQKSRAKARIVVLDCCFADRAGMNGGDIELAELGAAEGLCLLAASSKAALAEPGELHTAFTGELLGVLRNGVPDGPPLLDANTAFRHSRANLVRRGKPRPTMKASDTAGTAALSHNAQYRLSAAAPPRPEHTRTASAEAVPEDDTSRFTRRFGCAVMFLPLLASALILTAGGFTAGDPSLLFRAVLDQLPAEELPAGAAYGYLSALAVAWLGYRQLFRPYELRVSAQGIEVRRGGHTARYSWHRILEAKVGWIPPRRRGPGRFLLILRLREQTPHQMSWWARRAGRRRSPADGLYVADLGRLTCTPRDVDEALGRFAPSGVQTRTEAAQRAGYAASAPTEPPRTTVSGRTRRAHLVVLALLLTAIALSPSAIVLATTSAHRYGWAFIPLVLWTLFLLVPALVPALLLRHTGNLSIGADGITHTSGRGTRHWPWDRIDRVGVMSWRRRTPANGALFLRLHDLPKASGSDSLHPLLAPVEARLGGVLVCDLISLGITRKEVETVVRRYGEDVWDPGPRPEHGVIQDDGHMAHYEGRFVGLRALAALIGSVTASLTLCITATNPVIDHKPVANGIGLLITYTLVIASCLPPLTLRSPLTLQLDDEHFTLSSGRHRMTVPWDHIVTLEVSPSASGKETHDEVHLWLRAEEAHRYRGFRRLGAHLTAAKLHIVTLSTKAGVLRISPTRLHNALGTFARERFHTSSPAALRERER